MPAITDQLQQLVVRRIQSNLALQVRPKRDFFRATYTRYDFCTAQWLQHCPTKHVTTNRRLIALTQYLHLLSLLSHELNWTTLGSVYLSLLSTHADRQWVDISLTVSFVCVFVCTVTNLSAEYKAIAAPNFARRFICVQGRASHILGNFTALKAQNRTNRRARGPPPRCLEPLSFGSSTHDRCAVREIERRVDLGSACVQSHWRKFSFWFSLKRKKME